MHQEKAVGKRLKELRKRKKFSQKHVAGHLNISQAAYSLIENSQNGIVAEHLVDLSNLYEVTTDYILKGEKHLFQISPLHGFLPYYKNYIQRDILQKEPGDLPQEYSNWYRIPGYSPAWDQGLFEVEGDNMAPTLLPGDIVICQRQSNWNAILDGSIVLLVTKDEVLVRRLKLGNSEKEFILESDNPDVTEWLSIEKSRIKEIFMVRGKISNILVPRQQVNSGGNVQDLEDSIDFLKKELHSIQKKLKGMKR